MVFNRGTKTPVDNTGEPVNIAVILKIFMRLPCLDTKLTDTKFYSDKQGINPLKIVNGKIYLNGTIKPAIDDEITEIKKEIPEMKLLVNKI